MFLVMSCWVVKARPVSAHTKNLFSKFVGVHHHGFSPETELSPVASEQISSRSEWQLAHVPEPVTRALCFYDGWKVSPIREYHTVRAAFLPPWERNYGCSINILWSLRPSLLVYLVTWFCSSRLAQSLSLCVIHCAHLQGVQIELEV
jgi:hypothetical protein